MFSLKTKLNMARATILKDRPFYVQFYIGSRCTLNCRMCNIVEGNSDVHNADLATIKKMAKNLRKIGAGVVLLTGGEPFLRKDLPDIVKILLDEGLNPRLQTAGFDTKKSEMEACAKAGAKDINISLDSLVPEKQDYINGSIKNSWHKAIEAIVNANDVFSDPDRVCAFGVVLSKLNYMEVPAIAELATFMGWYMSLVPVHITNEDSPMNFRGVDEQFKFHYPEDRESLAYLKTRLHSMKKEGFKIFDSDAYLESVFYFLEHNRPNWRKNDICDSPNLYFAVLPNCDFAVCCDHRYGGKLSAAAPDFPEIYKSKAFKSNVGVTTKACTGCNFGSYPEVSISVRDPAAFIDRVKTVLFSKNEVVPKRSLKEVYEFIDHLRNKHNIGPYEGPAFTVKPGAYSQRYGEPELMTRGARKIPKKYQNIIATNAMPKSD